MEFRKQLSPLFQTCKDNQKLEKIINENVGSTELKNTIIEFFEKNKNCNEDEFDSRLHEFTNFLGKESVIWIFKLILASSR